MPRGRPNAARREQHRVKRLRAFELYAGGSKKSEIANVLGISKAAVGGWAKRDSWDDRLSALAARAQDAADHTIGETIADVVTRIRAKYDQRLRELDHLCTSPLTPPNTKIAAIKAWFELGQRVQPDAFRPASDPRNLELIQDLIDAPTDAVPAVAPAADPRTRPPE
jgi:predicted transcriptional regulator